MLKEIYNESEKIINVSNYIKIIIYKNETMLVAIENKDNVFSITRSEFETIEQELLDYDFYLYSKKDKKSYYIKIKEPNNEIRIAFDNSNKDRIFFGKEVLNKVVSDKDVENMIKKIGR